MSLSMDFGTCNSVIARRNEGDGRIDVVHLAGLSQKYPYRPSPGEEERPLPSCLPHTLRRKQPHPSGCAGDKRGRA